MILEAEAESEAVRVKGEAEAFAIEARAKAEAEQMAKKADAWKDYQDAAMIDMILETLPKVRHTLICYIYSQELDIGKRSLGLFCFQGNTFFLRVCKYFCYIGSFLLPF